MSKKIMCCSFCPYPIPCTPIINKHSSNFFFKSNLKLQWGTFDAKQTVKKKKTKYNKNIIIKIRAGKSVDFTFTTVQIGLIESDFYVNYKYYGIFPC